MRLSKRVDPETGHIRIDGRVSGYEFSVTFDESEIVRKTIKAYPVTIFTPVVDTQSDVGDRLGEIFKWMIWSTAARCWIRNFRTMLNALGPDACERQIGELAKLSHRYVLWIVQERITPDTLERALKLAIKRSRDHAE